MIGQGAARDVMLLGQLRAMERDLRAELALLHEDIVARLEGLAERRGQRPANVLDPPGYDRNA